jgi:hypothetical protein
VEESVGKEKKREGRKEGRKMEKERNKQALQLDSDCLLTLIYQL